MEDPLLNLSHMSSPARVFDSYIHEVQRNLFMGSLGMEHVISELCY